MNTLKAMKLCSKDDVTEEKDIKDLSKFTSLTSAKVVAGLKKSSREIAAYSLLDREPVTKNGAKPIEQQSRARQRLRHSPRPALTFQLRPLAAVGAGGSA